MTVDRRKLEAALANVAFAVGGDGFVSIAPIATKCDGISLAAENGSSWVRNSVQMGEGSGAPKGTLAVDHRLLSAVVRAIGPEPTVEMEDDLKSGRLTVRAGGKTFRLSAVAHPDGIVRMPKRPAGGGMSIAADVAAAVRWCSAAAAKDGDFRGVLAAVHVVAGGKRGSFVEATNGTILFRHKLTPENADYGDGDACVPAAFFRNAPIREGAVLLESDGKHLSVATDGEIECGTCLIEQPYPDIDRAIPKGCGSRAYADADELRNAVDCATPMAAADGFEHPIVTIGIRGNGGIVVSAGAEGGDFARVLVDAKCGGVDADIILNAGYVRAALRAMSGSVEIGYTDHESPVTLRCGNAMALIMPIVYR